MLLFLLLIKESFLYAISSLLSNRLRTTLSLAGVSIGVFCMIGVFTMVDALKSNIQDNINSLGKTTLYISKFSWDFQPNYPWWKYLSRPNPTLLELRKVRDQSNLAEYIAYLGTFNTHASYDGKEMENVELHGISTQMDKIETLPVKKGRYFTDNELESAKNVCVIGDKVRKELFENQDPIGKDILVKGKKVRVIGVLEYKEEGGMNFKSYNSNIYVTIRFFSTIVSLQDSEIEAHLVALSKNNIPVEECGIELEGIMRSLRKIKPVEENNFSINKSDLVAKNFEPFFSILSLAGIFIGGFSIIVGGFGIANTMFVSVKERTSLIGIQKALGAKNYFILFQFLFESILLALAGGIVGLVVIAIITIILKYAANITIALTWDNSTTGIILSSTIGLLAGIIPAYMASQMSPVEAMRK